jgi:hypothetical protein
MTKGGANTIVEITKQGKSDWLLFDVI